MFEKGGGGGLLAADPGPGPSPARGRPRERGLPYDSVMIIMMGLQIYHSAQICQKDVS